jgi:hypothetical protein
VPFWLSPQEENIFKVILYVSVVQMAKNISGNHQTSPQIMLIEDISNDLYGKARCYFTVSLDGYYVSVSTACGPQVFNEKNAATSSSVTGFDEFAADQVALLSLYLQYIERVFLVWVDCNFNVQR